MAHAIASWHSFQNDPPSADAVAIGLQTWCQDKANTTEHRWRIAASGKIESVFRQRAPFLSLMSSDLTSLPDCIGSLHFLRKVNFGFNKMTALSEKVCDLTNLEELVASCNNLSSLPQRIRDLKALERLYLSKNDLSSLPAEMGGLEKLQLLEVNHNRLFALPQEIGDLENLKELNASDNRLTSIPDSLAKLPRTCTILVEQNPLSREAIEAFQRAISQAQSANPALGPRFLY